MICKPTSAASTLFEPVAIRLPTQMIRLLMASSSEYFCSLEGEMRNVYITIHMDAMVMAKLRINSVLPIIDLHAACEKGNKKTHPAGFEPVISDFGRLRVIHFATGAGELNVSDIQFTAIRLLYQ